MQGITYKDALKQDNQDFKDTIIFVNGEFVRKSDAVISVYDSGFQHGDGVYEGIRAYGDKIFALQEHIDRLYDSCKVTDIKLELPKEELAEIVRELVRRNVKLGFQNIHMRLQVTRGFKRQTGMHPSVNISSYSVVICADEKPPIFPENGISIVTTHFRRYSPAYLDAKIHSCNQLNQILASIEAARQGAQEAIMLDESGFVTETNSTNIQYIKGNKLFLPKEDYMLPGITRRIIKQIAKEKNLEVIEKNCSLLEFYTADEVFVTGTVGEVVPFCVVLTLHFVYIITIGNLFQNKNNFRKVY